MYLNAIFLPLIGCLVAGFWGKSLGYRGSCIVSTACCGLSGLISLYILYEVGFNSSKCVIFVTSWLDADLFKSEWGFLFDTLCAVILVVVSCISFFIHLYSIEYIKSDPHLPRFISYLSLFTFFILILVSADNFLVIFLGWEGIGLASYLLINFWFTRIQANKAGIKAILVNRIGDVALVLAILTIYLNFETIQYSAVFSLSPALVKQKIHFGFKYVNIVNLIGFLLLIGACGKSAQFGLHTWLPDAIEGPTPVSALIHAATLVTGGVFLLARCSPLLEYANCALCIITIVGGITAFFAGTVGLVQNDVKKVIAYSTCSQLGYIIFACGCSQYSIGIYHLANHAFFKALLFLGAGSLIHGLSDEQDIRKIGGLRQLLPFTYVIISIGSFSLIGFPFITGFYSKDSILEAAYAKYSLSGHFAFYIGSFAAFLTGFYSLRLLCLCFLGKPNGYRPVIVNAHESSILITLPLGALAIPSIFIGYLLKDAFIGVGSPFWANAIFTHPYHILDAEFLPTTIKLFPLALSLLGGMSAYYLYTYKQISLYSLKTSNIGIKVYTFLNRKWYFDKLYNTFISQFVLKISYHITYKTTDRGILENYGPYGLSKLLEYIAKQVQVLQQKGNFYQIAVTIIGGLFLILLCFIFIQDFFLCFGCFVLFFLWIE
jgi:NADH-ubiquinone oxidoreductase chain 5